MAKRKKHNEISHTMMYICLRHNIFGRAHDAAKSKCEAPKNIKINPK